MEPYLYLVKDGCVVSGPHMPGAVGDGDLYPGIKVRPVPTAAEIVTDAFEPVVDTDHRVVVLTQVVRPMTLAEARAERKAAASAARWQAETGGVTVAGAVIRTDEGSQAKVSGAVGLFAADPALSTIDWEAQPGLWVAVDRAAMLAIGLAVGRHVQACFRRRYLYAAVIKCVHDIRHIENITEIFF